MAMSAGVAAGGGRRRHSRRPVMAEINVTPMVDVMLVLLIIFMVAAPLLTVGVPIDLPQTQANAVNQDNKEPITLSVKENGQIFLGDSERVFVRGDKKANYGAIMRVMGRLSGAGFKKVALVTEVEQGG